MATTDGRVRRQRRVAGACAILPVGVFLCAWCAAGCGRREESLGRVTDAAAAAPALPRFAPPQPVVALSDPDSIDEDPTFTGDLLELLFMSNRNGTKDLWTSHRGSPQEPWGAPTLINELSSSATDYAPAVSVDGLRVWFASDRDVARGRLWSSSRPTRAEAWAPPAPIAELASGSIDFAPVVDASETSLYFASNRPGGGGYDLYVAQRGTPSDPWGVATAVPGEVNSASDEYDPFIEGAGLVLFFTSMRSGMGDIYGTTRASAAGRFATPTLMTELDSSSYDSDSTFSGDLSYGMFSSTRSGNAEIYETHAL